MIDLSERKEALREHLVKGRVTMLMLAIEIAVLRAKLAEFRELMFKLAEKAGHPTS